MSKSFWYAFCFVSGAPGSRRSLARKPVYALVLRYSLPTKWATKVDLRGLRLKKRIRSEPIACWGEHCPFRLPGGTEAGRIFDIFMASVFRGR